YGVEALALNAGQIATLATALQALGANDHPSPMHRNHWRIRLDGKAAIYHGDWGAEDWTITAMKARLGSIFGVDPASIGHALTTPSFSGGGRSTTVVTFSRGGTDYLRMCEFGGMGASLIDGNAEVLAYLAANAAA
ncbi:MAG: hypothetical protein PHV11_07480, partial [Candidatus Bipolaricaulis sp.]|nr:hypothetical protein [Candidatus Bipolaricaulis sp.]